MTDTLVATVGLGTAFGAAIFLPYFMKRDVLETDLVTLSVIVSAGFIWGAHALAAGLKWNMCGSIVNEITSTLSSWVDDHSHILQPCPAVFHSAADSENAMPLEDAVCLNVPFMAAFPEDARRAVAAAAVFAWLAYATSASRSSLSRRAMWLIPLAAALVGERTWPGTVAAGQAQGHGQSGGAWYGTGAWAREVHYAASFLMNLGTAYVFRAQSSFVLGFGQLLATLLHSCGTLVGGTAAQAAPYVAVIAASTVAVAQFITVLMAVYTRGWEAVHTAVASSALLTCMQVMLSYLSPTNQGVAALASPLMTLAAWCCCGAMRTAAQDGPIPDRWQEMKRRSTFATRIILNIAGLLTVFTCTVLAFGWTPAQDSKDTGTGATGAAAHIVNCTGLLGFTPGLSAIPGTLFSLPRLLPRVRSSGEERLVGATIGAVHSGLLAVQYVAVAVTAPAVAVIGQIMSFFHLLPATSASPSSSAAPTGPTPLLPIMHLVSTWPIPAMVAGCFLLAGLALLVTDGHVAAELPDFSDRKDDRRNNNKKEKEKEKDSILLLLLVLVCNILGLWLLVNVAVWALTGSSKSMGGQTLAGIVQQTGKYASAWAWSLILGVFLCCAAVPMPGLDDGLRMMLALPRAVLAGVWVLLGVIGLAGQGNSSIVMTDVAPRVQLCSSLALPSWSTNIPVSTVSGWALTGLLAAFVVFLVTEAVADEDKSKVQQGAKSAAPVVLPPAPAVPAAVHVGAGAAGGGAGGGAARPRAGSSSAPNAPKPATTSAGNAGSSYTAALSTASGAHSTHHNHGAVYASGGAAGGNGAPLPAAALARAGGAASGNGRPPHAGAGLAAGASMGMGIAGNAGLSSVGGAGGLGAGAGAGAGAHKGGFGVIALGKGTSSAGGTSGASWGSTGAGGGAGYAPSTWQPSAPSVSLPSSLVDGGGHGYPMHHGMGSGSGSGSGGVRSGSGGDAGEWLAAGLAAGWRVPALDASAGRGAHHQGHRGGQGQSNSGLDSLASSLQVGLGSLAKGAAEGTGAGSGLAAIPVPIRPSGIHGSLGGSPTGGIADSTAAGAGAGAGAVSASGGQLYAQALSQAGPYGYAHGGGQGQGQGHAHAGSKRMRQEEEEEDEPQDDADDVIDLDDQDGAGGVIDLAASGGGYYNGGAGGGAAARAGAPSHAHADAHAHAHAHAHGSGPARHAEGVDWAASALQPNKRQRIVLNPEDSDEDM